MPFVHRIRDERRRARAMLWLARIGFRSHYHREQTKRGWRSLEEFSETFSRVLQTDTNYVTASELRGAAERVGLRLSTTYTKDFFLAKAFSGLGIRKYVYREIVGGEQAGFFLGKYVSSVTLLLHKPSVAEMGSR
jgi:hypothetical protein